jgi:hypothetical protein
MWPCIVTNFFLIKPTDPLISQIYFVKKLHVSGSSSVHHQECSTVRSTLVYVMQVLLQLSSMASLVMLESCHQICVTYTNVECTVENSWWWAEELPETCRVSWQNKFVNSVGLLVLLEGKVDWQFVTDVSGQTVGSILEGPADFS